MGRLEVHKFGGTSVGDAKRIKAVAKIIAERKQEANIVVVSSATSGTTDLLTAIGHHAAKGEMLEVGKLVTELETRHLSILNELTNNNGAKVEADIKKFVDVVRRLSEASGIQLELTARVRDRILAAGEKMAIRLFALALEELGTPALACDADSFLLTDYNFGQANPLKDKYEESTRKALFEVIEKDVVPVVTGFCGRAPDGATSTLGRGGSDLSATLLGAALEVDEVTIWTDVDGVLSANPKVVPDTRVIGQLNYREAAEMSFYGAKVLHQRTMIPVAGKSIPIWTKNSHNPTAKGTLVDGSFTPGSHPVKAVSAIPGHALVSIEGKGMAGVPGISARLFSVIANQKISVTMYSQSSSEASICLSVPGEYVDIACEALREEFQLEFMRGDVERLDVQRDVALVAVVGIGMAKTPGVAGRTMDALAKENINILAIAQGSSELNITLAVDDNEVDRALRALHSAFGLHRIDAGVETPLGLDLVIFGSGKIGRAVAQLVLDQSEHIKERLGLSARVIAMADTSGYLLDPKGFDNEKLIAILKNKSAGVPIAKQDGGVVGAGTDMVSAALNYRLTRPVLVDTSDADGTFELFLEAFGRGCDVVTANKKPLGGNLDEFLKLMSAAKKQGRVLKGEATVGAGLPVIDTLEVLRGSGDRLFSAEGSLSGTLGFIMSRLEAGTAFSKAVKEAFDRGFTEPDPAVDLTGEDVARKATILGRLSGMIESNVDVELEGLVDSSMLGLKADEFFSELESLDVPMSARIEAAKEQGKALRYLARVEPGKIQVGPVAVPMDSPAGRLRGTENLIVFKSTRYDEVPLVITGPGAGIDVTAMGVFGDILRIASERK